MTTFHTVHLVVGIVLAAVNFWNMMDPTTRTYFNAIIGLIVFAYNAYYLFGRNNVDVRNKETGS